MHPQHQQRPSPSQRTHRSAETGPSKIVIGHPIHGINYPTYRKNPPQVPDPFSPLGSIPNRAGSSMGWRARPQDPMVQHKVMMDAYDKPRASNQPSYSPPTQQIPENDNDSLVADTEMETALKLIPMETNFMLNENKQSHNTAEYELQSLVLRRGQQFKLGIKFDKQYDPSMHKIFLQFTLGSRSLISKGTHIRIPVQGAATITPGWSAKIMNSNDIDDANYLTLAIESPPDAFIGRYKMYIETQVENSKPSLFRYTDEILLIFNPFIKEDASYMQNADDISEYLLSEKGVFYVGTENKITPKHWHLGQFQFPCIEIALWLLERANLPYESRGDPMQVTRALSAMINGGDRGILMNEKFDPSMQSGPQTGFHPHEWAGSVKIVKKFMEQRGQPVRHGNCYVFAALLCTMCRSIGLPCRIVTGFRVAHDCDMNSTFDVHWDKNHRPIYQLNKDVIWTHHSWNEVWFYRKDIPAELNGWEAVDSTSNAASESLYRLGPCPVNAITNGRLSTIYDSQYISSCLNNYIVHWMVGSSGEMSPIGFEKDALAPLIVTKAIGSENPVDITANYKHPADPNNEWPSALARRARIEEMCSPLVRTADDVEIDVMVPHETTLGDTIVFAWNLKNRNKSEKRTCEFYMSAFFITYDFTVVGECKEARGETLELMPSEEKHYLTKIRADDYMDRIKPNFNFKVYLQAFVNETGQTKALVKDVCLDTYDMLRLLVDKTTVEVGQPIAIRIQICNPLKRVLQQCALHFEGIGVPRTVILERSIRPLETTVYPTQITPTRVGQKRELVVNFSSSVLTDIQKCIQIDVLPDSNKSQSDYSESVIDDEMNGIDERK